MTNLDGPRLATPNDAPALVDLINRAFRIERSFKNGDRTDLTQVHEKLATGSFFVIEDQGELVGCIYTEVAQSGNPHTLASGEGAGYIGMLAIDPGQQGRGLGRQLMLFAEAELARRGCTRVQIRIINVRSELYDFYGRMGYRETGTTPYPAPERVSRPIHFVNLEKGI